ncbi:hypothetical protein [Nocardia transvalensis]|uniref:hypothetical protein n=1 Tax=Nocardia transvalensis TaxID=37333 RepID=UPI001894F164|nr:hypothetical protein [Nocardia transvalensis]MBF6332443.1 hypothetical protein [Nocardia transvalensis]
MTDRPIDPGIVAPNRLAVAARLEPCPHWCERPAGHGWEDVADSGDLIRVHWRIFPIPDTDHGTVMVSVAECLHGAVVQRDPINFVIDTGLAGDCEMNTAGARGLARVLAEALTLAGKPL